MFTSIRSVSIIVLFTDYDKSLKMIAHPEKSFKKFEYALPYNKSMNNFQFLPVEDI